MTKFTSLVVCVVAVNLNSVYAASVSIQDINTMLFDCAADYNVSFDKLEVMLQTKDVTMVNPCFFGCLFRNTGFLNDKGEYDLNSGLTFIKNSMPGPQEFDIIKEITTQCESAGNKAVSDGEAGCERGALLVVCFMEEVDAHQREKL